MENANSKDYLEKIKIQVIENLKRTAFAPSVQMTDVPRDPQGLDDEADAILDDMDEDENKDSRYTKRRWDKYVEKDGELSDSDGEDDTGMVHPRGRATTPKRRNIQDNRDAHLAVDYDSRVSTPDQAATQNGDTMNQATNPDDGVAVKTNNSSSQSPTDLDENLDNAPPENHQAARIDLDGDVVMNAGTSHEATVQSDPPSRNNQISTPPLSPATALEGSAVGAPPTPPSQTAVRAPGSDGEVDEGDTLEDSTIAREEMSRSEVPEEAATHEARASSPGA